MQQLPNAVPCNLATPGFPGTHEVLLPPWVRGARSPGDQVKPSEKPTMMSMRRGRTMAFLTLAAAILSAPVIAAGWSWGASIVEWPHRSPEYVLWKYGLTNAPVKAVRYRGMFRDTDRDSLVRGKTLQELRAWFPELKVNEPLTAHQKYYEPWNEEHYWIGDTWWAVVLEKGRGVRLDYVKG